MKRSSVLLLILVVVLSCFSLEAQSADVPDQNFHIYICFGQSNMEGNAAIGDLDKVGVNPRFQVMDVSSDDYSHNGRKAGEWYTAVPPLCRWNNGLTPADYFGRVLTDSLPSNIKIGIVMVAIGGASIDAFDKEKYKAYYESGADWLKAIMDTYDGRPYDKLIEMARKAQKDGVIKGILLHQGETNNGDATWPVKVKKIYDDLLSDLGLEANSLPLLAGEMLQQNQQGICYGMNDVIATLPHTLINSYVISSEGCTGNNIDGLHFSTEGARELGKRYGKQMYSLLKTYNTIEGQTVDHLEFGENDINMLTGTFKKIPLTAVFADGHKQDVSDKATYEISNPNVVRITGRYIDATGDGKSVVTVTYKGLYGASKRVTFNVSSSTFPLTSEYFNPSIWTTGSFDETTKTLVTGQWGFGGWQYSDGLDLSQYKYLIVQLEAPQSCDASFRFFDENNYWSKPAIKNFGTNTSIAIDLHSLVKDGTTTQLDPSHIYIAGIWSSGGSDIKLKDIFFSDDGKNPTSIKNKLNKSPIVNVYNTAGIKIRSQVNISDATIGLPKGLYIVDRKSILVN